MDVETMLHEQRVELSSPSCNVLISAKIPCCPIGNHEENDNWDHDFDRVYFPHHHESYVDRQSTRGDGCLCLLE